MPGCQGGADADGREHCGPEVGDRRTDSEGRAVRLAGQAHGAPDRLDDHVVRRLVTKRTAVAIAGNGSVDEPRVTAGKRLPAVTQAIHYARTEVFDDHVTGGQDRVEDLSVVRALEVERDAFLVAVECHEIP